MKTQSVGQADTHSQRPACPGWVWVPHGESTCTPLSSFCSMTQQASEGHNGAKNNTKTWQRCFREKHEQPQTDSQTVRQTEWVTILGSSRRFCVKFHAAPLKRTSTAEETQPHTVSLGTVQLVGCVLLKQEVTRRRRKEVPAAGSAACRAPSPAGRRGSLEGGERAGQCRHTGASYRLSGTKVEAKIVRHYQSTQWRGSGRTSSDLVVGVVAAAAELVPALGAAEVHAAALSQSILEPAVRACYKGAEVEGQ